MNEHDFEDEEREPARHAWRWRDVDGQSFINPGTLFKILAVFVIPVAAGIMLLFFDPTLAFLITVALYASLWFLFNPFPALLLFMLLVAVRPQEGIPQLEAIHVERLCAVLAIVGWGLRAVAEKKIRPVSGSIAAWFVAFVVACFLSVFTSVWKLGSANALVGLLKVGILAFLISQMVDTPKRLFVFLLVFALGHAWMAAESLRLYYSEGYNYVKMGIMRATTGSESRGDPNSLAASLVISMCFALYVLWSRRNLVWRVLWLAVIGAGSFVVVLTGSRAAMLASLFLLFYIWLTRAKKFAIGVLVGLIVVASWFAMPSQYKDRFLTTFDFERNPSAAESAKGRIEGVRVGLQMFIDRPLLGVGIGNFSVAHATLYSPEGRESWLQAHNLVAQVAGETGILGLITFAGFVIACMRQARRAGASLAVLTTPDAKAVRALSRALVASYWLLLFLGLFSHNVMRYNWYLNAGLVSSCVAMAAAMGSGTRET